MSKRDNVQSVDQVLVQNKSQCGALKGPADCTLSLILLISAAAYIYISEKVIISQKWKCTHTMASTVAELPVSMPMSETIRITAVKQS